MYIYIYIYVCVCVCVCMIKIALTTWSSIPLSLSYHPSQSSGAPGRSSKLHPVSAQN